MKRVIQLLLFIFSVLLNFSCDTDLSSDDSTEDTPDSAQIAMEHLRDSVIAAQGKQQIVDIMGNCIGGFVVPGQKTIDWKLPGPPTAEELKICGTWTAVMDEYGLRAENEVVLADTDSKSRGVGALLDAAKNGQRGEQKCAWLEFYDDHSGFWNSCMVEDGKPVQLVSVNTETQKSYPSGLHFDWYKDGNIIHIRLEDCLKYSLPYNGETHEVLTKYWDIQITKTNAGQTVYFVNDYLPEFDYTSPVKVQYQFSKGTGEKVGRNFNKPPMN